MTPYTPAEDSFLLASTIGKFLISSHLQPQIALDIGSGTGIQAETLQSAGIPKILCADISQEAVDYLNSKGFKAQQSDLFSNIKTKFDLIVFNPPYLPGDPKEDPTIFAGPKGNELIIEFLKQAREHLNPKANIILLFSSLSDDKTILEQAIRLGYAFTKLSELPLFQETLYVYQFYCHSSIKTNI